MAEFLRPGSIAYYILLMLVGLLCMGLLLQRQRRNQDKARIRLTAAERDEQFAVLKAISDVYYSLHVIDLRDMSVVEYNAKNEVRQIVGMRQEAVTTMRQIMQATMTDEYLAYALEFTDLTTLAERMKGKRFTYTDLLGRHVGWIQLAFIAMETDDDGRPVRVICTTQVIEEEKRREQALIYKSNTDELTGFLNRRAYEEALDELTAEGLRDDFVYVSVDVNGLKVTNDTLGHQAGDELLRGAADTMRHCLAGFGRVYRTGGDEFVALLNAEPQKLEEIIRDFNEAIQQWKGQFVESMAVSVGYATRSEFPSGTLDELAGIADQRMYEAKSRYYQSKGTDRRGQAQAHTMLCASYTKILKINVTTDTFEIVNMHSSEEDVNQELPTTISGWFKSFADSGRVHPDDMELYTRETNLDEIRRSFHGNRASIGIRYRRRYMENDQVIWKEALMELLPAEDYTDDNQTLYLYVKKLDK